MNFGVRRLLGGGTLSPSPPPTVNSLPTQSSAVSPLATNNASLRNWPPESDGVSPARSPAASKPQPLSAGLPPKSNGTPNGTSSGYSGSYTSRSRSYSNSTPLSSPGAGPSSPRANGFYSPNGVTLQPPTPMEAKDELLISLLSSEAVVDSRESDILTSEEVDELKREHRDLTAKLNALNKKIQLDTKIRDASTSLAKAYSANSKSNGPTSDRLSIIAKRLDTAQLERSRVAERANDVHRRLLEHRAGVLSLSVRSLEAKLAPNGNAAGSGRSTPSRAISPPSSVLSVGTSSTRFDGAHLFAGHSDTIVPQMPRTPGIDSFTSEEKAALEEKLRDTADALKAANAKQTELARELTQLRLSKMEEDAALQAELQASEDKVARLERDSSRSDTLATQLRDLQSQRAQLEREHDNKDRTIQTLERRLAAASEQSTKSSSGLEQRLADHRANLSEKEDEIRSLRAQMELDKADSSHARDELDSALAALQELARAYDIYARGSTLSSYVSAIRTHLSGIASRLQTHAKTQQEWDSQKRKLEDEIRVMYDERGTLSRDLEEARDLREDAQRQVKMLEMELQNTQPPSPGISNAEVISILKPIWAMLPSPVARATKLSGGNTLRISGRSNGSPSPAVSPLATSTPAISLSDMDVRSLKALYDARGPNSPTSPNTMAFSLDAFATRVQALVADDRALIERLLRFAQAHDMLKKNAERAQKLALDGSAALETYQKQVRTLEERNSSLSKKQVAAQDEVQRLRSDIERVEAEKRELESRIAKHDEEVERLAETNNTLMEKNLSLAEEAAQAPERVRQQLEVQIQDLKKQLALAEAELDEIRTNGQTQRIQLLDELNSMQKENGSLRAQLRAAKK